MSDTIYTVPEQWRLNLYTNPTPMFQDLDNDELWEVCMFELFSEVGGEGFITATSFKKGYTPWNKGLTGVQTWTEEQKEKKSKEVAAWHKEQGHVVGGKVYEKRGYDHDRKRRSLHTKELNSKTLTCPHCGTVSNVGNAKRWHFDNCKHK